MLNFIKKHAISIKISRHANKPIIQAILKILKIETGKLTVPQNKTKDNCFNCGAAGHWAHSCTEHARAIIEIKLDTLSLSALNS